MMKILKQILKYVVLGTLGAFLTNSCNNDDDTFVTGNSVIRINEGEVSFFDVNSTLTLTTFELSTTTDLTALEVFVDDNKVADGVILDGSTATITTSPFVPFEFDVLNDDGEVTGTTNIGTVDFSVVSTEENGEQGETPLSFNVIKPLSFSQEIEEVIYGDTVSEDVEGMDDKEIIFGIFTVGASVDAINVSWSKNSEETFTIDENLIFVEDGGSIDLKNLDYVEYGLVENDTLNYQIVATSGSLMDMINTSVILKPQQFMASNTIPLRSNDLDTEFSLQSGEASDEENEILAEITYSAPLGFTVADGIEFIKLDDSGAEFYEGYTNISSAVADFEGGTQLMMTTQVEAGDIYVYKVTRNEMNYFGAILVDDIVESNIDGVFVSSFNLLAKENTQLLTE